MPDYSKYRWSVSGREVRHGGKVAGVVLDTALLDAMTRELSGEASQIIEDIGRETVIDIATERAPVDTGDLANSYMEESGMVNPLLYRIQDGVPYGIFQELGTSRMAAQPHVVPAVEEALPKVIRAFTELFKL